MRRYHATYSTKQKTGTNGRPACLNCDGDIDIGSRRRTFCGDKCTDEFYLKTGRDVRRQVWLRDKGICALCGVDTMEGVRKSWRHWSGTGHRWQADHIVPVVEGGGVCTLENFRTLCTACHKRETAELAARRARDRRIKVEGAPKLVRVHGIWAIEFRKVRYPCVDRKTALAILDGEFKLKPRHPLAWLFNASKAVN